MNLSFAGCGFLGIYHVGVAVCFRKYAPHLLLDKISGASAGAIAACCLICDLPIGGLTSDVLRLATEARSRSLGPFSPSFNIQNLLLEGLEKFLPNDAHIRVSGKLHVSLTRVYDGKNVIVSQFNSREELLQALLASSFVPVFSGIIPPKFQGVRYADGGFSNNLPALDENTITVSPFCGESDICPRDNSSQLFHINVANTSIELSRLNIYRMTRILFPPKPELLSDLCKQGFDDALRFLHRNNLISCTRCLAVQSTFVVAESLDECFEYDPECNECKMHQEEALLSNMPDTVLTVFQEAIDSANKGLVNWIFKHRGMKLLSVLSLPYTLPADIVYATFTNIIGTTIETHTLEYKVLGNALVTTRGPCQHLKKQKRVMSAAPSMGNSLWDVSKFFLDQFSYLLSGVSSNRQQQQTAKISCQLAYTEYGGSGSNIDIQTQNKMNLNLTLNLNEEQNVDKKSITNRIFSRRKSSITISRSDTGNEDTFENILQVTSQHDAIMAYYFMDENNKVKVTEIFDVTESDSSAALSQQEREVNTRLEFDDDWNESAWTTQQAVEKPMLNNDNSSITDYTLDEIIDKETSNIFCNPESEWLASTEIETEDELMALEDDNSDSRPESDQVTYTENLYKKPFKVPSFNYEELDI